MKIFNKLKHLLSTAHILNFSYPFNDFIICIDACKEGLGWVLIQENCFVSYESRNLKEH